MNTSSSSAPLLQPDAHPGTQPDARPGAQVVAQSLAQALAGRDRVLLYTRGMDIDPEEGVSLALQSLRRAGKGAAPDTVMEELFGLLRENNRAVPLESMDGNPIASMPPLNRRRVVPKGVEPLSFSMAVARWFRALFTTAKNNMNHDA